MKRFLMIAAFGVLCACGEPAPNVPQANEPASPARFVGGWATTSDQCADPPWRFTEAGLSTAGEVSCDFRTVTETDDGYAIDASCTAQAPAEDHQITLRFPGLAQVMRVSGGPWSAPIDLVSCAAAPAAN